MIQVHAGITRFVANADLSKLHHGYPPGGPQDRISHAMANRLLSNPVSAGAIEITLTTAKLTLQRDCLLVVGGAASKITIDGVAHRVWQVLRGCAGSKLRIEIDPSGCRAYVCVAGGLAQDPKDSNHCFAVGDPMAGELGRCLTPELLNPPWAPPPGTVRAIGGPEFADSVKPELAQTWIVSPQSSGMGLRLTGKPLPLPTFDIVSSPVQDGTIQATATGLIALLRQRGTLGGYPRVATVIDCDVDRLAQLRPGKPLRINLIDHEQAAELCRRQQTAIRGL
ncbi:MAG: hypothetical protein HKN47_13165 [Pirellulaceae bacterium]|nr:hypothetical protein [Pirellulaceae bacterium]